MSSNPAFVPLASVVLIAPGGTQQIVTDTLDVTNIPFRRSLSEMMETMSFTVPGNHWIDPSEVWRIAVEYRDRVLLYGLVGNCTVTVEGEIINTEIEAVDMTLRLTQLLVPIDSAQMTRIGMTAPLTFTAKRPDEILIALLGTSSYWATDTFIRPGAYITETGLPAVTKTFDAGTTRLEAIQSMADEKAVMFCLIYSKTSGVYYADAFFGYETDLQGVA